MDKKFLIVIVGPTAVGKTSLSIKLAKVYKSEIVSADSRQFFRELKIGTAKPNDSELKQVRHHFINNLSVEEFYDVGQYERDAISLISNRFLSLDVMFLVGGSGLYVDAVCNGLDDFPEVNLDIRERLNIQLNEEGLEPMLARLKLHDLDYFKIVDQNNPQRIIRALEVFLSTGKPFSTYRKAKPAHREFEIIKIGLDMDRSQLYERIDQRMDQMIELGLFEEAEQLNHLQHLNALQTVGYKEIFGFLNGAYDREEAVRLLKRNSRRYAKRQLTWFKKDKEITWFAPTQLEGIKEFIETEMLKRSESKD